MADDFAPIAPLKIEFTNGFGPGSMTVVRINGQPQERIARATVQFDPKSPVQVVLDAQPNDLHLDLTNPLVFVSPTCRVCSFPEEQQDEVWRVWNEYVDSKERANG